MSVEEAVKTVQNLVKENRLQEAIDLIRASLKTKPGDQALMSLMGDVFLRLRRYSEAQTWFARTAGTDGKMPVPAAIGLTRALIGQQKHDQARKIIEPVLKAIPNSTEALICMAKIAIQAKNLGEAEGYVSRAEATGREVDAVRHERAKLEYQNKNADKAIALFEANIDRADPFGDSIDAWLEACRSEKRELYLRKRLQEISAKYPRRPEFVFGLGATYARAGEVDNARKWLSQADKMLPNNYRVLYERAVLERLAGDIEHSQKLLERVLELHPTHPTAIRTFGVDHKYSYGDSTFVRLNTEAASLDQMGPMDQVQIHYALGKAFDDVGELSTAFKHYQVGGLKKRKIDKYNEQNSARMFQIMKKVVNKETLPLIKENGCQDETPVFILGMPRSGTSLMEQILSSHNDIYGAGELKFMTSAVENIDLSGRRLKLGDIEPAFAYDLNASFAERGQWYVDMLKSTADKPYKRIVDKMPGNFNFVPIIHALMPNAKIIHSRRHPVETCLSCYRILFAEGHQWTYDLGQLGRYYKRYWDLMQHWRNEFPGIIYEVRYEDNVADVEGQAKALIDYLGLEWDDKCLNFYNTDRPVKTASASQVRKPIYKTSTNRWRKYEKYLGPLLAEIGDIVEQYESEIAHLQAAAE